MPSGQQIVYVIGLHCKDIHHYVFTLNSRTRWIHMTQNILEHYSQWSAAILSVKNTSTVLMHTAVSTLKDKIKVSTLY